MKITKSTNGIILFLLIFFTFKFCFQIDNNSQKNNILTETDNHENSTIVELPVKVLDNYTGMIMMSGSKINLINEETNYKNEQILLEKIKFANQKVNPKKVIEQRTTTQFKTYSLVQDAKKYGERLGQLKTQYDYAETTFTFEYESWTGDENDLYSSDKENYLRIQSFPKIYNIPAVKTKKNINGTQLILYDFRSNRLKINLEEKIIVFNEENPIQLNNLFFIVLQDESLFHQRFQKNIQKRISYTEQRVNNSKNPLQKISKNLWLINEKIELSFEWWQGEERKIDDLNKNYYIKLIDEVNFANTSAEKKRGTINSQLKNFNGSHFKIDWTAY